MALTVSIVGPGDAGRLAHVAEDVFDLPVDDALWAEFLADPRHHLAVATDDGVVVGMASGVHYVHPDKPPQLFINEVGVAESHRGRGIAKQLLERLLQVGREQGCTEAWVLTDRGNAPAMRLYEACGGEPAPQDQVMFTFWLNRASDQSSSSVDINR